MGSIYMNDPANNQLIPVVKEMVGATGSTAGIGGLVPAPHAGDQNKVFYGDGNYKYPMNTWAGTCTTAANERIKEVSTDSAFALVAGAMVIVRYTNTNTYESSTGNPVQLDVNGTGARNIWYSTDDSGSGNTGVNVKIYGDSTRPIIYVYDGTYWVWVGCSLDSNTTYTPAGLGFGYGTCSTAASGTAKTVTLSGYSLVKNGIISVRFTYDVPASATLNVNSKGAKPIRYNNVAITDGVINAGDLATFIYTGSYYMLLAVDKATQPFTGASSSTNGTRGLVPPPQAGDENKVLRGDGTWGGVVIPNDMTGATATTDGTHGLIKQPHAGDQDKVFQGNGTWGHKLQIDIVEQNGVYGYIDSGGNFVSFKSQADIDAAVAAAMVGTATAADVKAGVTFTNSTTSGLTGTFAAQEKTVTAGTSAASVTPDSGKYLSKVTYNPTPSQTKSASPSTSAQTISPDSGKLLSSVSISAISPQKSNGTYINSSGIDSTAPYVYIPYGWYPQYSGKPGYSYVYMTAAQAQALHKHTATYTPTANSSASDMGSIHNYRYVDTRTVYNLGSSAGLNSGYTTAAQVSSTGGSGTSSSPYTYSVTNGHYYLIILFNTKPWTIQSGATLIKTSSLINSYNYVQLIKATSSTLKVVNNGYISSSYTNSSYIVRLY